MSEILTLPLRASANLKAYYRLENVNDDLGANNLTNNNGVAFNAFKYGLGGDGGSGNTNKFLSAASNLGIAGNGDLFICFWLLLRDEISAGVWTLMTHESTTTADRYIQLIYQYNAGTRRLSLDAAGTSTTYNVTLGNTATYFMVITRDVAGNSAKLYIDTVERIAGTIGTGTTGTNRLFFMANADGTNATSGIFDEVAIFDSVLTTSEIATIYNEGGSGLYSKVW